MPHLIPTRAAAPAGNSVAHGGAPDVDPQDRIDSLLAHLGTRTEGLSGREAPRRVHHAYLQATTMTRAGIVACQMGAAFAVRTNRDSLREVGVSSNPDLVRGVAFSLPFAAAIIYLPPACAGAS